MAEKITLGVLGERIKIYSKNVDKKFDEIREDKKEMYDKINNHNERLGLAEQSMEQNKLPEHPTTIERSRTNRKLVVIVLTAVIGISIFVIQSSIARTLKSRNNRRPHISRGP